MATRAERFAEFQRRLGAAPAARSFDEAYGQVCRLMNEVEDDLSGVAYNILTSATDGRMYPPLWDFITPAPGWPGVRRLLSRGHLTFVGDNGAVRIDDRVTGRPVFAKPGEDGRKVDDL